MRDMRWILCVSLVGVSCGGLGPIEGIRKARVLRDGKMEEVKGGLDFGKAIFEFENRGVNNPPYFWKRYV